MEARLTDVAWRFGVTAATDEVATAGSSFLQLRLTVQAPGGCAAEPEPLAPSPPPRRRAERPALLCPRPPREETLEMTLPQFYKFAYEMERANAALAAQAP